MHSRGDSSNLSVATSTQAFAIPLKHPDETSVESMEHLRPQVLPPPPNYLPPADRGLQAWLQVAGGWCIFFNTWGLVTSFGVFQSYYETTLLRSSTSSQISWIGTVQACFICFGALYAGPLYDRGYLRTLLNVGSFGLTAGLVATSFCQTLWQCILAQGVLMGLGLGCLFIPMITLLSTWFQAKRGAAMGVASSGSAIGGILYPVVFYKLAPQLGFGWAVRTQALMMLVTFIVPVFGMKMRIAPMGVRKLFDPRPWLELPYILFAAALFFGYLGLYIPYFYFQLFCLQNNIVTGELNFYLLAIMNAGGLFGRLAWGKLADVIGVVNALIITCASCVIVLLGWIGVSNSASAVTIAVLYGFCSAGVIILPPTAIATTLCPDMKQYPVRMTMQMVPFGIGILVGNPIAGAVLNHGWAALQAFSTAAIFACLALLLLTRNAKVGMAWKKRC